MPGRIAVSSNDFRRVSGHAGQAQRWLVFETGADGVPVVVERLDLPPPMVFHRFKGPGAHPLDGVGVLITRFAGQGFLNKMRKRGIEVRQTRETDAEKAVAGYCAGTLPPPPSRRIMSLICKVRDAFSEHR
jgi:Uncharacterized conserved protein